MLIAECFFSKTENFHPSGLPHLSVILSNNHARTSSPAPVTALCDPLLKCRTCPGSRCRRGNHFHTPERHSCREAVSLVGGDPLLTLGSCPNGRTRRGNFRLTHHQINRLFLSVFSVSTTKPSTSVILSDTRVPARASRRTPKLPVDTMPRQGVLLRHSGENALVQQCRGHCTGILRLYLAPLVARCRSG